MKGGTPQHDLQPRRHMVLHRHPIQQLQDAHHFLPIQEIHPGQSPSTTPSGGYRQEVSAGVSVTRGVVDTWVLGSQVRCV